MKGKKGKEGENEGEMREGNVGGNEGEMGGKLGGKEGKNEGERGKNEGEKRTPECDYFRHSCWEESIFPPHSHTLE